MTFLGHTFYQRNYSSIKVNKILDLVNDLKEMSHHAPHISLYGFIDSCQLIISNPMDDTQRTAAIMLLYNVLRKVKSHYKSLFHMARVMRQSGRGREKG